MQSFGLLLLSFFIGQGDAAGAPTKEPKSLRPGNYTRYVGTGEAKRSYIIHVPAKYDPSKKTPVVLALHGATMTASLMQSYTGLDKKADQAGFIVVYPNGTGPGNMLLTWNAGGFAPAIAENKPDDVVFIGAVLDDLERILSVDKKRVFACGLSNGGMMCYRLAAEMSQRIAAIASIAGAVAIEKSAPKRAVPVLHFHGTADQLVPYGGPNKKVAAFLKFSSVEESIGLWVKLNGCNKLPEVFVLPAKEDKHEVTRTAYRGGKRGAEVILYTVKDGGHTWPGRRLGGGILGDYTLNIDANDLIWKFFLRHPMQ